MKNKLRERRRGKISPAGLDNSVEEITTGDLSVSEEALATGRQQTDSAPVRRSNRHREVLRYLKDHVTGRDVKE